MALVDKTIYYYLILFATFLFTVSFIPILFEIIQQNQSPCVKVLSVSKRTSPLTVHSP